MSIEHHIPVRSARNRLIDLLGMGAPYPLSDLNVVADHLRVAFGSTAKVPIECAQAGVRYELCGPQGETVSKGLVGADATLTLETPAVSEDITYRVRATTVSSPQLQRFLDEGASVKVVRQFRARQRRADPSDPTPSRRSWKRAR